MAIHPWGDHDADANYEVSYERGVSDERAAILDHIAARRNAIIKSVGYRTFETLCDELEQIIEDVKNERHL